MRNWRCMVKVAVSVCSFIYRKGWGCKRSVNGVCGWCCGCSVCNGRRTFYIFLLRALWELSQIINFTDHLLRFSQICFLDFFMEVIVFALSISGVYYYFIYIPLHVKCCCVSLLEWNDSILIENFARLKKKTKTNSNNTKNRNMNLVFCCTAENCCIMLENMLEILGQFPSECRAQHYN